MARVVVPSPHVFEHCKDNQNVNTSYVSRKIFYCLALQLLPFSSTRPSRKKFQITATTQDVTEDCVTTTTNWVLTQSSVTTKGNYCYIKFSTKGLPRSRGRFPIHRSDVSCYTSALIWVYVRWHSIHPGLLFHF